MRKWLFIFLISLLLLSSIQPTCGQNVSAKDIYVSMVFPLNTEYPLFEANNYENMIISNEPSKQLTFEANITNFDKVYEDLKNNPQVKRVDDPKLSGYKYIGFQVQNYPDYEIYLYPDLLWIKDTRGINTPINGSDLISNKSSEINDFFHENFEIKESGGQFEGQSLLPPLNKNDRDVCALDWDSWAKQTRIIMIGQTEPTINDTNVESYKTRLFGDEDYENTTVSKNKCIIYHETVTSDDIEDVGLLLSYENTDVRAEYLLPLIELNTVIFPVAEKQIDDASEGIEYSIRELHDIEVEISSSICPCSVMISKEKLKSCKINETNWNHIGKDLAELDDELDEVLQVDNYYIQPYKVHIERDKAILSRDVEDLNRRIIHYDEEYGRISSLAESRLSTLIVALTLIIALISLVVMVMAIKTNIQSKKSSEKQTKILEDVNSNLGETNKMQIKKLEDISSKLGEINSYLKKLLKPEDLKPEDKRKSK